ncbi:hypothetical protein ACMX25_38275 [Caballeronia sp. 15715]|uniref:hypothetical protein n=1 Tax=Caballeronia sp. 15715 TaxID=3391030 RepID=UPI0039E25EF0
MAVDHQQLPKEEPESATPPSRLVWTIVFVVLLAAGGAATALIWPKYIPTNDWRFWATLVVLPSALASFIVSRRLSAYEASNLDIQARNEVVRAYNQRVFDAAGEPFAVLAAAYRFSFDRKENALDGVRDRSTKLVSQAAIAQDAPPVHARWLLLPSIKLAPGSPASDKRRHIEVAKWLFGELLDELAQAIKALPQGISLDVHFAMSSLLSIEERDSLWNDKWEELGLRHADIATKESDVNLMTLDRWLDQTIEAPENKARLVVAVQLHVLQSKSPPPGSAEAAVALLVLPEGAAARHAMISTANLHRPASGGFLQAKEAICPALKWARVAAPEVKSVWETGFDDTQWGQVISAAGFLGLPNNAIKVDQSIGFAGVAAPWLAVAYAAKSLSDKEQRQMVFAGSEHAFDCAVLVQTAAAAAPPSCP